MKHFVEWKPFYTVGDHLLDEEHRQILDIINDLYMAIESGNDQGRFQDVLDRLTDYTVNHFDHEERVMRGCGYPEFEAHREMHVEMRRRTRELKAPPDVIAAQELLQFVKNWWVRHIQNRDKAYAPYLDAVARPPIKTGAGGVSWFSSDSGTRVE